MNPVGSRIFSTPRPMPSRLVPTIAGATIIALALPVFAIAGWPLRGWALAAVLWVASEIFGLLLARLPNGPDNLAAAGVRGIGTTSRALLVGIVLVIVTVSNETVGLAAAILYAIAFTAELGVGLAHVLRWGGEGVKRALAAVTLLALTLPATALAQSGTEEESKFDPSHEWELQTWGPELKLGPIDMSINKAVAYLFLGTIVSILIGILLMRVKAGRDPNRRQALGETIYEVAQVQVAEQGLPTKAIGRWFPYVATLMVFIWVINMLGFIPLPLSDERWEIGGVEIPTLAIFAATSTLSVTLALALMTFMFTHVEGIRENGATKYFKSWIPEVPKAMLPMIIPLEILGQFMRLISLSVRLYANMLAGHMLILTFIGLIFLVTPWVFPFSVLLATIFYLFEVVIVVSIQAYIFAALSAIYIGSAIEPEH